MTMEQGEGPLTQGHQERFPERVPELWCTMSRVHPAAWGLPSTTITIFSAATFPLVLALLTLPPGEHESFRLPEHGLTAYLAAAGIAGFITIVGSRRPGPLFPRLWSILLTISSGAGAALTHLGAFGAGLLPAALGVSALAAASVLLARLVPVSPRSWLLRRIAPLTALLVLLGVIPSSLAVQEHFQIADEAQVADMMAELQLLNKGFSTFASSDKIDAAGVEVQASAAAESGFADRMEAAVLAAQTLDRQGTSTREADILTAYANLLGDIEKQANGPNAGWTSELITQTAPTTFKQGEMGWVLNSDSAKLPAKAKRYQSATGLMLDSVKYTPSVPGNYLGAWEATAESITSSEMRTTFANAWSSNSKLTISNLVQAPLNPDGSDRPPIRLSDPDSMFGLSRTDAQQLASPSSGCRWVADIPSGSHTFSWLECFGFLPTEEGSDGRLSVVLRLIYDTAKETSPDQLYVLFLPPNDADINNDYVDYDLRTWAWAMSQSVPPWKVQGTKDDNYKGGFCVTRSDSRQTYQAVRLYDENTNVRTGSNAVHGLVVEMKPISACQTN